MTLTEFLLARIAEDYRDERGDAVDFTFIETAARLRANVRRLALVTSTSHAVEAQRYSDHPDYDDSWQP